MNILTGKLFKGTLISLCLLGFTINSLVTIRAFLDGAKVNSRHHFSKFQSSVQPELPTIVLCNYDVQALNTEIGMDIYSMEKQDSLSGWLIN